jgi:hypothetical protein
MNLEIYHQILKEKGSSGNLLTVISSLEAVRNDSALAPLFCLNLEQFIRPTEPVFRIDKIKAVSLHLNTNCYEQSYWN